MSYAEFTYPLLQAWDWWHMYNTKGIQMQIGGSDQYGNITAGIDAVKYISAHHPDPDVRAGKDVPSATPYGFTVPLLTTSSGVKFGKSAGNAIWLDKDQTSSFDLYGFFVRQSDEDVSRYLKLFTFMPIPEIETLMEEHMKAPSQRLAQHKLAREFLELVHGPEEAKAAEVQHRIMYQKYVPRVEHKLVREGPQTAEQLRRSRPPPVTLNNAPAANIKLPRSLIENRSIGRIIYAAGLAASASEGHRFAAAGSVYIGARPGRREAMNDAAVAFTPITVWTVEETKQFLIDGNLLILRKGKHNVRIVEIVEDDVWAELGTKYPGEVKEVAADKRA
jgi:tyrosyl-tRNA synthetase